MSQHGENPWTALLRSASRARRRFGGYVVHLGIVLILVAIAASQSYVTHTSGTVRVGSALKVGEYRVKLLGFEDGVAPHKSWKAAKLEVVGGSHAGELLAPRMNFFERSTDPIGTPAVKSTPFGDLYVSLLALSEDGQSATFNAWVFPLVGWIWWSIPILVLGALIAIWPARRSRRLLAPEISRSANSAAASNLRETA